MWYKECTLFNVRKLNEEKDSQNVKKHYKRIIKVVKIFWSHLCVRKSLKIILMTFRSFSPHFYYMMDSVQYILQKMLVFHRRKEVPQVCNNMRMNKWSFIYVYICLVFYRVCVCTFWIISSSCSRYSLLMLYCCSSTREKCSIRVIESFSFRVITMSWWRTH